MESTLQAFASHSHATKGRTGYNQAYLRRFTSPGNWVFACQVFVAIHPPCIIVQYSEAGRFAICMSPYTYDVTM